MPAIIVHGGAWNMPDQVLDAHRRGVKEALLEGWAVLRRGEPAIDAVEKAVNCMEDDPNFDAGRGSFLNSNGEIELDAAIMEGKHLMAGSVAAVKNVAHPISLARKVMEKTQHVLLVGAGANQFAESIGFPTCTVEDLLVGQELELWRTFKNKNSKVREPFDRSVARDFTDTVGCVAVDASGNIAAGTSTGGLPNKLPGRVGDSPLIGSGLYADNESCGVSATGWGEPIMKVVLSKTVSSLVETGLSSQEAAEKGIKILGRRISGFGGVIVIDRNSRIGFAYNTRRMAYAYLNGDLKEPVVGT
jgi:beta-aspartyl-peptidase (threonine type)